MPGITGSGLVRITPYKLNIGDIERFFTCVSNWQFDDESYPSKGFASVPRLDDFNGAIQIQEMDRGMHYFSARFSRTTENIEIKKKVGPVEFEKLSDKLKYLKIDVDTITYAVGSLFALVSTIRDNQLRDMESSCFNDPSFTDHGINFNELPDDFNCGPDLLLWLVYFSQMQGGKINENLRIIDIEYFHSEGITHKITYSGGSTCSIKETCSSIAQRRPISKLKIILEAYGNTYSFVLHTTGRTEIAMGESKAHDDHEDQVGRRERIILDIYQICLPELRSAYTMDHNWTKITRSSFIEEMKRRSVV